MHLPICNFLNCEINVRHTIDICNRAYARTVNHRKKICKLDLVWRASLSYTIVVDEAMKHSFLMIKVIITISSIMAAPYPMYSSIWTRHIIFCQVCFVLPVFLHVPLTCILPICNAIIICFQSLRAHRDIHVSPKVTHLLLNIFWSTFVQIFHVAR